MDEAPLYPVPEMFEPNPEEKLGRIRGDFDALFPEDPASRWILELMTAQNDICIVLKLLESFSETPDSDDLRQAYQNSHYLFFYRMLIAQTYEAWLTFNQKDRIESPIVKRIVEHDNVKKMHQKIRDLLGKKFNGGKTPLELMEKLRLSAFHYSDNDAGNWAADLKSNDGGPVLGIAGSKFIVDRRWIVADKFVLARLRQAGLGNKDLHGQGAMRAAMVIIRLIDACIDQYKVERDSVITT
jgi:hypothetical protein